jgi:ribose 5-phosphate isomerase B
MKIVFASDHAGFELKTHMLAFVRDVLGYEVIDCGAETYQSEDDYPDYVAKAARMVSENPSEIRGIIFGGSGQGEAMVANRFPHVRATVFYGEPVAGDLSIITLSREHNDATILSIGARFVTATQTEQAVTQWLSTPFSNDERHTRRIQRIEEIET